MYMHKSYRRYSGATMVVWALMIPTYTNQLIEGGKQLLSAIISPRQAPT